MCFQTRSHLAGQSVFIGVFQTATGQQGLHEQRIGEAAQVALVHGHGLGLNEEALLIEQLGQREPEQVGLRADLEPIAPNGDGQRRLSSDAVCFAQVKAQPILGGCVLVIGRADSPAQHLHGHQGLSGAVEQNSAVNIGFFCAEQTLHLLRVLLCGGHVGQKQMKGKAPRPKLGTTWLQGNGPVDVFQARIECVKALLDQPSQKKAVGRQVFGLPPRLQSRFGRAEPTQIALGQTQGEHGAGISQRRVQVFGARAPVLVQLTQGSLTPPLTMHRSSQDNGRRGRRKPLLCPN